VSRRCWTPLGPNVVLRNKRGDVLTGRFNAIAVDPGDASGKTVYAGAGGGGVWKTSDGGVSWSLLGAELETSPFEIDRRLTDLPVSAIAVRRVLTDGGQVHTVVAVGTGERDGFLGQPGGGVIASFDGGASWRKRAFEDDWDAATRNFYRRRVSAIAVVEKTEVTSSDPNQRLYFVAGTGSGLYESWSFNARWRRVPLVADPSAAGHWTSLVVSGERVLGARRADAGRREGIYEATPQGMVLVRGQPAVLPAPGTRANVALAAAPSDSKILYAAFTNTAGMVVDIFRSADGGGTWHPRERPSWGLGSGGDDHLFLVVHPSDPDRVYLMDGRRLFHSFDGGATATGWDDIDEGITGDALAVAIAPATPFVSWLASTAGVYVSPSEGLRAAPAPPPADEDSEDDDYSEQETSWEPRMRGLATTRVQSLAQHPSQRGVMAVAAPSLGLLRWHAHPLWRRIKEGRFFQVAIDPNEPTTWYATTDFRLGTSVAGVLQSKDSGSSWEVINDNLDPHDKVSRPVGGGYVYPEPGVLAIDPAQKGIVYFGTDTLYRRSDAHADAGWVPIANPNAAPLSALAVAPSNPKIVYAGGKAGELFRFEQTTSGFAVTASPRSLPMGVSSIAVDPFDADAIHVALGYPNLALRGGVRQVMDERLWFSPDGGVSWRAFRIDLPPSAHMHLDGPGSPPALRGHALIRKVLLPPDREDLRIFLATDLGVFVGDRSQVTLTGWRFSDMTDNLPRVPVSDVALLPPGPAEAGEPRPARVLRAATFGRGVWERALDETGEGACEGTDVYLRSEELDTGTTALPASAFDPIGASEEPPPQPRSRAAPDLKLDRRNSEGRFRKPRSNREYLPPDDPNAVADFIGFEVLPREEPQADAPVHVYVQVHNHGPSPARVNVRVLFAPAPRAADGSLPPPQTTSTEPLPSGVFGPIAAGHVWQPVGDAQEIEVRPAEPAVVRWTDWKPPRDLKERIVMAAFVSPVGQPFQLPFAPVEYIAPFDKRVFVTYADVLKPSKRSNLRWWLLGVACGVIGTALLLDALDVEDADLGLF
jgi:hypothetical protein